MNTEPKRFSKLEPGDVFKRPQEVRSHLNGHYVVLDMTNYFLADAEWKHLAVHAASGKILKFSAQELVCPVERCDEPA